MQVYYPAAQVIARQQVSGQYMVVVQSCGKAGLNNLKSVQQQSDEWRRRFSAMVLAAYVFVFERSLPG